mmetsp:Transcript_9917/g.60532  ORF Transcript_9917/g.60532 Transcript_9917/m.60532 type:complete len:135 (-) Transcript_9917:1788-2192(-)
MRAAMDGGCALFSPRVRIQGRREGSLHGLTFVAKDLFAVKGWRTSFGTPKWRDTHETAQENAEAVERMLQSGAELVGMAHMDEMAYSLNGENAQFGTPVNPRTSALQKHATSRIGTVQAKTYFGHFHCKPCRAA